MLQYVDADALMQIGYCGSARKTPNAMNARSLSGAVLQGVYRRETSEAEYTPSSVLISVEERKAKRNHSWMISSSAKSGGACP